MGSICCVPSRPRTTSGSVNGCSNIVDELHCCSTGGFSPASVSQQWEKHENSHTYTVQMDRASLSSSSRGSRSGSAPFICHQHTPSDSVHSHGASPCDSFSMSQWASTVLSQSGNFNDLITATGEMSSSPATTLGSQKEGISFTPLSSTPESNLSYKQEHGHHFEQLSPIINNQQSIGFYPPLPPLSRPTSCRQYPADKCLRTPEQGRNSCSSFSGSRHSFRRSRSKGSDSNRVSMDNASDWWSVQTFSELVASSRKERLRWTRARSPSDFGYALHRKSNEKAANYTAERIRACSSEVSSVVPVESHRCSLCSKLLSDSPTNSKRMVLTSDLTVVGVLSCGHVFHSTCLEEVTPECRKQDPPCPQCEAATKIKAKTVVEAPFSSKIGWMTNSFHGQSSSRNKLSRIVAADNLLEPELRCRSMKLKGKVLMHDNAGVDRQQSSNPEDYSEKPSSRKLLSKRAFSFKGKTLKDVLMGDGGRKIYGSSSQVSPDKSFGEKACTSPNSLKDRVGSFRYLKGQ